MAKTTCETCLYFAKKNGVYWCMKKDWSTSPSGGAFCRDYKSKW